jgi:sialate O-acetylesterase
MTPGSKKGRNPLEEVRNTRLERFAIAGRDRKWHWANAVIHEDRVIVSSPAVPHPIAVRYAYAMNPEGCNLYNRAGLPVSPLRTDRW